MGSRAYLAEEEWITDVLERSDFQIDSRIVDRAVQPADAYARKSVYESKHSETQPHKLMQEAGSYA